MTLVSMAVEREKVDPSDGAPGPPDGSPSIPAWTSALSIHNAKLDDARQRLLLLCQEARRLAAQPHVDDVAFHQLLNDLMELADRHFAEEERWLAENACPLLDRQRLEHETFIAVVTGLLVDATQHRLNRAGLLSFLSHYAWHHIVGTDVACQGARRDRRPPR